MRAHRVRALLMGGQACVFYGAAEFSRDTDFAILADAANLARLRKALAELRAGLIAVPPFELKYLRRGHAIHFRCQHPEALRMRVDVMSKMRGVDSFAKLWQRRTVIQLRDKTTCDLLSLPDLVSAKKTQRDKDWPMIRRLVEAHYFSQNAKPSAAQIKFWLQELRTPQLLIELAQAHFALCRRRQVSGIGTGAFGRRDRRTQAGQTLLVAPAQRIGKVKARAMNRKAVEQVPIRVKPNPHNARYLKTKREKMGHLL
jgi:hypothetical protein